MTRTRRTTAAALAVLVSLFLALPLLLVVPSAQALTSSWAGWSPVTGTSNDYALRLQPASAGFPAATVASDSRASVQLAGGTSTFLGAGTPPGLKYGSSVGSPYLVLRPRADTPTSPSTTTYTFDDPTPDTGWAFVLGDIDSDQVQVRALDATGAAVPAARIDTWFRGAFNYTASGTDVPSWSATTSTLTGNATATDTDGASGWFEPDLRLSSLTLVFTRRAGFPVYQTWFVTRARPLTGTVTDVSGAGDSCPPQSTTLTLVSPYGEELTTTQPGPTGAWSFGEWATQDGYTVRLAAPPTCAVVGPAERPLNNRGADGSAASQGAFQVREIVPQPISGRVVDGRGDPVAGVSVTLTRPDTTTVTRTTDPDGRYLFDENPVGVGYTLAVTVPPGYVAGPGGTTRGPVDVAAVPIAIADVVVVALPAVSGQVTGGGDGLGGVPVTLTPAGGGPVLTTTTRGDGTYTFTAVPAGPVTIAVTPPPGYTAPPPLTPTVGTTDLAGQDIALTRPGGLSGTVLDAAGTGVAGVDVTVSGPGAPTTVQTDDAGAWFLDGVPAGTWTATPTPPPGSLVTGPAALTATITQAGELRGGLDFTLAPAPSPTPTPTATPTATPTTTPTATPSPTATATAEPSGTPSASEGPTTTATGPTTGGLPDTGGPPLLLAVLAGALVLSGVGLIARAHHRG